MERKVYLGDSVYAEYDGFTVILTTENGSGPSNTIFLEPSVMQALNRFYGSIITDSASQTPENR